MLPSVSYLFVLLLLITDVFTLTLENVYTRFINKHTIDQSDVFGYHVPKPIAYKGDEPIWPRSYGYSAEMFFDENGAAFPVRPRKKIGNIIRPLQLSVQKYDEEDSERRAEKRALRDFYRRLISPVQIDQKDSAPISAPRASAKKKISRPKGFHGPTIADRILVSAKQMEQLKSPANFAAKTLKIEDVDLKKSKEMMEEILQETTHKVDELSALDWETCSEQSAEILI